jgi:hypothetical protein
MYNHTNQNFKVTLVNKYTATSKINSNYVIINVEWGWGKLHYATVLCYVN